MYAKGDIGFVVNDVRVEFGWLRRIYLLVIQKEKKKKTQSLGLFLFYVLRHDEKEEKETFVCVCVCVERENFCRRCSRVRERAKGNRCDVMKAVVLQR